MTDWDTITTALRRTSAFSALPPRGITRLLPHARFVSLTDGEVLFAAGDDAAATYILADGEIDITGPGCAAGVVATGFLGEKAALGLDRFRGSAIARGDARVIVLPRDALDDLRNEAKFHERVLSSYSDRFLPGKAAQDEAPSG